MYNIIPYKVFHDFCEIVCWDFLCTIFITYTYKVYKYQE